MKIRQNSIRHAYKRYMEGLGGAYYRRRKLNAMGSVPNRSAKWNRNTVRDILRNPTYAGKVAVESGQAVQAPQKPSPSRPSTKDGGGLDRGGRPHPAIIPGRTGERVQGDTPQGRHIPIRQPWSGGPILWQG